MKQDYAGSMRANGIEGKGRRAGRGYEALNDDGDRAMGPDARRPV